MIAPLPDRPPADDTGMRPIPDAEAAATAAAGGIRFADLLARSPSPPPPSALAPEGPTPAPATAAGEPGTVRPEPPIALADPRAPVPPGAGARLFNQDGFFGAAVAEAPGAPIASGVPTETPLAEVPAAAHATFERAELHAAAPVIGAARSMADATPLAPQPRRATAGPVAQHGTGRPVAPADRPGKAARAPARAAPRPAPAPRRAPPPPSAAIAVAVHALAHGMEVVARVADLDPTERSALAEEIAALLSSHGYAPARVGVTAVLPAREEHR